jgi:hypothetical protein
MAVVFFGRRSAANTNAKWQAPNTIVDPAAGYVNPRVVERKDSKIPNAILC